MTGVDGRHRPAPALGASADLFDGYLIGAAWASSGVHINQWLTSIFLLDGYLTGVVQTGDGRDDAGG